MNIKTLVGCFASCFIAAATLATPPNTITRDGLILEYDANDLAGSFTGAVGDPLNMAPWGQGNMISNVFVTWDAEYLYVAAQGYVELLNANKIAVLIDVDPGNDTGVATTTNWTGTGIGYIDFNDVSWRAFDPTEFGADYMIATEGNFNNVLQILYDDDDVTPDTNTVVALFDQGNGSGATGQPVDMATTIRRDPTDPTKSIAGLEARIPWSVLYGNPRFGTVEPGEVVPRNATLKLFANVHVNQSGFTFSSPIVVPEQGANASYTGGRLIIDSYAEIVIDSTGDGFPDLAAGDENAPWIRSLNGVQGQSQVYVRLNEEVDETTAEDASNWLVNGLAPTAADRVEPNAVLLTLAAPLPAAGTLVVVSADGVEDTSGNSKFTFNFLNPASAGIEEAVSVRFILNVNSGFGAGAANPRATNFFVNGDAPLDWGFPPDTTFPLAPFAANQHFRDVVFPPGSPLVVNYKYSGVLSQGSEATGQNNYEAIRHADFGDASRQLVLPTDGSSLVVTDWLGAAAAPYRDPNDPDDQADLYNDSRRGDAGVRQRAEVVFQVDLSGRNRAGITRVILLGSDPLRGFNNAGDFAPASWSDYPLGNNDPFNDATWADAGIELFDDGTRGDLVAGDGIYSRRWAFTTTGLDTIALTGDGTSLVGGSGSTKPYVGSWFDRRSPRSFDYKFAIYKAGSGEALLSPEGPNLRHYLGASVTNVVFAPHVWENDGLPLPPPTNSPTMLDIQLVSGGTRTKVVFDNPGEPQHGVLYALDLKEGLREHGLRGVTNAGLWEAVFPENIPPVLSYAAYAGPAPQRLNTFWTPNPVPATGGVVHVWFSQITRNTRGYPQVNLRGNLAMDGTLITAGDWQDHPMTFLGDGLWHVALNVAPLPESQLIGNLRFGFRNPDESSGWDQNFGPWGTENYRIIIGGRATWEPENPAPEEILTVTYDATGGPLLGGTNIWLHAGFNKHEGTDWINTVEAQMTNVAGEVWTVQVPMPTNSFKTFNMLFRERATPEIWDNEAFADGSGLHTMIFSSDTAAPANP
ncbi:MAG TPA: hypothetical protein PKE55_04445 [Kiritimatiellia bacterium]|nr:hypothetical protein [Kiritimatiellia bacterium]